MQQKCINPSLLKFDRPTYKIIRPEQLSQKQRLITKLMQNKPQIGFIEKSPLIARVKEMLPLFDIKATTPLEQIIDLCEENNDSNNSDSNEKSNQSMQVQSNENEITINLLRYDLQNKQVQFNKSKKQVQIQQIIDKLQLMQ